MNFILFGLLRIHLIHAIPEYNWKYFQIFVGDLGFNSDVPFFRISLDFKIFDKFLEKSLSRIFVSFVSSEDWLLAYTCLA